MNDLNLGLSKEEFGIKIPVSAITASQLKNNSFILSTNGDKEPTIKIGEGYFWYRGEKIEDTRKVYELFADFLIK